MYIESLLPRVLRSKLGIAANMVLLQQGVLAASHHTLTSVRASKHLQRSGLSPRNGSLRLLGDGSRPLPLTLLPSSVFLEGAGQACDETSSEDAGEPSENA